MKVFLQSLTLILATLTVFAIVQTPLFSYIPLMLGFLTILALSYGLFKRRKRKGEEIFIGSNKEIYTILVFILLIVFITGGIKSPIFFLTYFILFGIAFIFEPIVIFLFLLCLGGIFLPDVLRDDVFSNSIKLASLVFLTPIAFFFGREYRRREKLQAKVQEKTEVIIEEAKQMLTTKDRNERLKKTEQIIEEAEALQKET